MKIIAIKYNVRCISRRTLLKIRRLNFNIDLQCIFIQKARDQTTELSLLFLLYTAIPEKNGGVDRKKG